MGMENPFLFPFITVFGLLTRNGNRNKKSLSWKPKPALIKILISFFRMVFQFTFIPIPANQTILAVAGILANSQSKKEK